MRFAFVLSRSSSQVCEDIVFWHKSKIKSTIKPTVDHGSAPESNGEGGSDEQDKKSDKTEEEAQAEETARKVLEFEGEIKK